MHCQRCQKSLRSGESVKCDECESCLHVKCIPSTKNLEGGDRGYQWKCAVCKHPAGKCNSNSQTLLNTVNQLGEKFELINKIQLPKLNSDLMLLRSTADRIVKQNEDILNRINQLQKSEHRKTANESMFQSNGPCRSHRRIPLNLSKKSSGENNDAVPILSSSDKCARYKTRQRSYHLYKVFLLVNQKLLRTKTPRNKSPR